MRKNSLYQDLVSIFQCSAALTGLLFRRYTVLPAYQAAEKDEAFHLRHKVFCDELKYEPGRQSNLETDPYDAIATQMLVKYAPANAAVGCARFIPGRLHNKAIELPFEKKDYRNLNRDIIEAVKDSGYNYAELSRLTIDKQFRYQSTHKSTGLTSKIQNSVALLTMFLGIRAYVQYTKTRYVFAIVEQKLINRFHKVRIPITILGDPVEFHGERYPILIDMHVAMRSFPGYFIMPLAWRIRYDLNQAMSRHEQMIIKRPAIRSSRVRFIPQPLPSRLSFSYAGPKLAGLAISLGLVLGLAL